MSVRDFYSFELAPDINTTFQPETQIAGILFVHCELPSGHHFGCCIGYAPDLFIIRRVVSSAVQLGACFYLYAWYGERS
jgi:hypothetical protein